MLTGQQSSRDLTTQVHTLSQAVEQSPVATIITDQHGTIEYINPKFSELSGYTPQELLGKNPNVLQGADLSEATSRELWQTLTQGKTWQGEFLNKAKNGRNYLVRANIFPIFNPQGEITNFVSLSEDITRLREVERSLQNSRYTFNKIINTASEGFWFVDNEAITINVNPAMCSILGQQEKDILGKSVYDFLDRKNRSILERQLEQRKQGRGSAYEITLNRVDGSQVPCFVNASPYHDEQGSQQGSFALVTDISARKETVEKLIRAKDEALRANRATARFLASMNHELRTPLNAILGFSELLAQNPEHNLNKQQLEQAGRINLAGEHLLDLINNMVDLARIEVGSFELRPEKIKLDSLCTEIIQELTPLADTQHLRFNTLHKPVAGIYLQADKARCRQVLHNLVSNAVKYSPTWGTIDLNCVLDGEDTVLISIRDYGCGIQPKKQKIIFEPFQRAGFESSDIQGTGIGLTIAKKLTELMGGDITVKSQTGRGSCFTLQLPGGCDSKVPKPSQTVPQPERQAEISPTDKSTLLYIEDNPGNILLMKSILARKTSLELVTATTGSKGLEMAADIQPELILTDITLPDIDGFEVLKRLQNNPQLNTIPVIALSGSVLPEEVHNGMDQGFIAYLAKPINIGALLNLLSDTLARDIT